MNEWRQPFVGIDVQVPDDLILFTEERSYVCRGYGFVDFSISSWIIYGTICWA